MKRKNNSKRKCGQYYRRIKQKNIHIINNLIKHPRIVNRDKWNDETFINNYIKIFFNTHKKYFRENKKRYNLQLKLVKNIDNTVWKNKRIVDNFIRMVYITSNRKNICNKYYTNEFIFEIFKYIIEINENKYDDVEMINFIIHCIVNQKESDNILFNFITKLKNEMYDNIDILKTIAKLKNDNVINYVKDKSNYLKNILIDDIKNNNELIIYTNNKDNVDLIKYILYVNTSTDLDYIFDYITPQLFKNKEIINIIVKYYPKYLERIDNLDDNIVIDIIKNKFIDKNNTENIVKYINKIKDVNKIYLYFMNINNKKLLLKVFMNIAKKLDQNMIINIFYKYPILIPKFCKYINKKLYHDNLFVHRLVSVTYDKNLVDIFYYIKHFSNNHKIMSNLIERNNDIIVYSKSPKIYKTFIQNKINQYYTINEKISIVDYFYKLIQKNPVIYKYLDTYDFKKEFNILKLVEITQGKIILYLDDNKRYDKKFYNMILKLYPQYKTSFPDIVKNI